MNVAEYIIDRLVKEGCGPAFLVYGGAIADLVDALPGRMPYVVPIHEQAAGFAAEGWAKARADGTPGLVISTSGPGGGNLLVPLQNCFYDSTPLIVLTGQVNSKFITPLGSDLRQTGFQETPIVDIVKRVTKYAVQAKGPLHAAFCIETAIFEARSGRRGPTLVDLPLDVQRAPMQQEEATFKVQPPTIYPSPEHACTSFLIDLTNATRPGILVGGGAHAARDAIVAFATARSIPVFRTWNAFDVMTDDSPVYAGTIGTYGGPGRNFGIQNCDLLLAIGCRLSGRITGGMPETFAREAKLYVVDVDRGLLEPKNQQRRADVNVWCDAAQFMEGLR